MLSCGDMAAVERRKVLVICSASDGSLRAPVERSELEALLEPSSVYARPPAEHEQYRRLVAAARAGARLHWGFDSLHDAMMLLLGPSTRAPRFGLAPDEQLALGVVDTELWWRDASLLRPAAGSMATEVPHLLPAKQRERLRWSIFSREVLVFQPEQARVEDALTVGRVWELVMNALARASRDRRAMQRIAQWPRTAAGWEELWSMAPVQSALDVLVRVEHEVMTGEGDGVGRKRGILGTMTEALRQKVLGWINIGPLGTLEGREQDIRLTVDALGEGAVATILDLVVEAEAEDDEDFLASAHELAEVYAARFPKVTADTGLSRLSAHGPASVVVVLGATGERGIVPTLLQVIDTRSAPVDVVIAFVDCLAQLGGQESREALEELGRREEVHPEIAEEIEIALESMKGRG